MNSCQRKNNIYDSIAQNYDQAEFAIAKKYSYGPTFARLCKNIEGKQVVDVACGSGYSTRILAEKCHPESIFGIDASKRMIEFAKKQEKRKPQGIKYFQESATGFDFNRIKPLDVVTALFLLHYADSKEELYAMAKSIYDALPQGGNFITVTSHPKFPRMLYKKYEITSTLPKLKEGAIRTVTYWKNNKRLCSFETYYWKLKTLKKILKKAGFKKIIFRRAIVSSEGYKLFGRKFWNDYLKKPHIIGIICHK